MAIAEINLLYLIISYDKIINLNIKVDARHAMPDVQYLYPIIMCA